MKNLALGMLALSLLNSCATPSVAYDKAKKISYPKEVSKEDLSKGALEAIKEIAKDPDSVKYLKHIETYKCYASKSGFTDNISPKYDYGYLCHRFSYRAKNSYGGYGAGEETVVQTNDSFSTAMALGEVVRKADNVWVYFQ